jgi:hypothetical protein
LLYLIILKRFSLSKGDFTAAIIIALFLLWKLSSLSFRFGDENVYFYMTKAIKDGFVPYKDFNLADPPAFIYLLSAFSTLIGKHFILFKIWPPLFDAGNALLIFFILKKLGNKFAALGPALYLFSFTILSTSDYVTGAETAIFFMLLAIYLDMRGKSSLSGIAWALGCLSKLYIAPALLAYLCYKLYKKEFLPLRNTIVAGIITGLLVLLPFFIISEHETFMNLIGYQLKRPAGLNKWNVFSLFFEMESLLIVSAIAGAFVTKHKALLFPLLASFAFLLWFKDLYYLYLHLLVPFLAIYAAEFALYLNAKKEELLFGFVGLYAVIALYPIFSYIQTYAPQGTFQNPEEVASALSSAPLGLPVYGVQEVAPLVALIANKSIFQNVIDTNTQNFGSEALNIQNISDSAIKNGVYLVARIADYPEQGVTDTGYEAYFYKKDFSSCTRYKTFRRPSPGDALNDVVIYKCAH